jgi:hypothetical protein
MSTTNGNAAMTTTTTTQPRAEHAITREEIRYSLEPRTMDEAFRLAQIAAKAKMYGVTSPEDAVLRLMTGRELGLTATQSLRGLHSINGKVGIDAALMIGLALQDPEVEYIRLVESTAERCVYVAKRRGSDEISLPWTMDMARRAKLADKDIWKAYPDAMLRARCCSAITRVVAPGQMFGLSTPEELRSIAATDEPRDAPHGYRASVETVTADGEVIAEGAPNVEGIVQACEAATTLADLEAITAEVLRAKLDPKSPARARIASAYKTAKARVTAPPIEATPIPAAREPGED